MKRFYRRDRRVRRENKWTIVKQEIFNAKGAKKARDAKRSRKSY